MEKRLSQQELANRVTDAAAKVAVGARYEHYKGMQYQVITVALLEATSEPCVVYKALYGEGVTFVRLLEDWLAVVEVEGRLTPRFSKL